jgi:hypothetical protein
MSVPKLVAAIWPNPEPDIQGPSSNSQLLIVDLRDAKVHADTLISLTDLAAWCVRQFAHRTRNVQPIAVIVRHRPAGSGRTSEAFFAELALCGVRAFVRQMRYDRAWRDTPLTFVDARDASDQEITDIAKAVLTGPSRLDIDRSSGATAGARWKMGDSI